MTEKSARFGLPLLQPGQAQKEVFHNEALLALDGLVHPVVEGLAAATPPAAPEAGQAWIVGAGSSGAWAGQEDRIAFWTAGGWRFLVPVAGMMVWNKAAGHWIYWAGSGWSGGELAAAAFLVGGQQVVGPRLAAVPSPSGGTTIDAEARAAVDALIVTIKSHGLTD